MSKSDGVQVGPETPIELINGVYATLDERVGAFRQRMGRPLTLAEKILANHLDDIDEAVDRGVTYNDFRPDRVAMQDATAPDGLAPVHDLRPRPGRRPLHHPLRSPDPGPG